MGEKIDLPSRNPDEFKGTSTVSSETKPIEKPSTVVLAIGEVSQWRNTGRKLPWNSQITFAGFEDIEAGVLERIKPDIILSPLLCRTFDCLDLAQSLQSSGFRGRYRIMSPQIPNPVIVLKELRMLCPSLDVDIILDGLAATHGVN
ncbi:MAG: hypothetical protein COB40_01065 [Marinosulfonomonas sp.]|nr:MAG: hypothetical protein COB40_01065 [Marinosulfonomonas sp.]